MLERPSPLPWLFRCFVLFNCVVRRRHCGCSFIGKPLQLPRGMVPSADSTSDFQSCLPVASSDDVPSSSLFRFTVCSCFTPFTHHLIVQTPFFNCTGIFPTVALVHNASPRAGELHWMTPRRLAAHCLIGTSLHNSRGNTQHAAPEPLVASISSKFSIVLQCRRCCSMSLLFYTHPCSTLDNPSRSLNSVNFTMFCTTFPTVLTSTTFPIFTIFFQPATPQLMIFHNFHSTRHAVVDDSSLHGWIPQENFRVFDSSTTCLTLRASQHELPQVLACRFLP